MKLTAEHYDEKYTIEVDDGIDVYDLMKNFEKLARLMTYQPTSIYRGFEFMLEHMEEVYGEDKMKEEPISLDFNALEALGEN